MHNIFICGQFKAHIIYEFSFLLSFASHLDLIFLYLHLIGYIKRRNEKQVLLFSLHQNFEQLFLFFFISLKFVLFFFCLCWKMLQTLIWVSVLFAWLQRANERKIRIDSSFFVCFVCPCKSFEKQTEIIHHFSNACLKDESFFFSSPHILHSGFPRFCYLDLALRFLPQKYCICI